MKRALALVLLVGVIGCGGKSGGGLFTDPQVSEIVNHPYWKGPITAGQVEKFVATVQECKKYDRVFMERTSGEIIVNRKDSLVHDPETEYLVFPLMDFKTAPDRATILRTLKRRLDEKHHES